MAHQARPRAHRRQVGMNPGVLSQIQASNSAANDPKATTKAPAPTKESSKPAETSKPPVQSSAKPASVTTNSPAAPTTPAPKPVAATPTSSSAPAANSPSSAAPNSQSTGKVGVPQPFSSPASSSSAKPSSSSSSSSFSSQGIRTITPSRNLSSSAPSATAASAETDTKGISGGSIAGIVIGLILGIVLIGGLAGWFYRKYKERNYGAASTWTKMDNDDVTPYRDAKRTDSDEEFYGGPAQHSMGGGMDGQSRAVEQARNNAFYDDGSMRPDSMAMGAGFAGYGAGVRSGPYPDLAPIAASYDPHGRPYTPTQQQQYDQHSYDQHGYDHQHQQFQQPNPFDDEHRMASPHSSLHSPNSPHQQNFGGPRQLVGPGQQYGGGGMAPVPAPVPLGRPQPPQSYDEIAAAEMYADDRYADDHMAAPPHLGNMPQHGHSSPDSFATAEAPRSGSAMSHQNPRSGSAMSHLSPMPEAAAPLPLPTFAPMSPLMNELSLNDDDIQPHHIPSPAAAAAAAAASPYDDDTSRMYTEVARAAGVPDPNASAHLVAPPLSPTLQQDVHVPPAIPYQHGMPLSPLREVPTPASSTVPLYPEHAVVAQRVTVPTAAPVLMPAANAAPRPLPSIPGSAPNSNGNAQQMSPARPDSLEDAYGGI